MRNTNTNNNSDNKKLLIDFMEKYNSVKNGRSELWKYIDEIRELLENDYMIKHMCHYLRFYRNVKLKEKTIYDFIYRNRDKILNTQTSIEQTTTQPEPVKEELKQQQPKLSTPQPKSETKPATKEPEQKKPQSKDKYEVKTEEENPLTYEEYSKDYDDAEEVYGEEIYKYGLVFKKDTWKKLSKEEFAEVEKYLQTHHIQFTKKEYYTLREIKQKCIVDENIDLRFYLMYVGSIKNADVKEKRGLDDRKVVTSLENFVKSFAIEKK